MIVFFDFSFFFFLFVCREWNYFESICTHVRTIQIYLRHPARYFLKASRAFFLSEYNLLSCLCKVQYPNINTNETLQMERIWREENTEVQLIICQ